MHVQHGMSNEALCMRPLGLQLADDIPVWIIPVVNCHVKSKKSSSKLAKRHTKSESATVLRTMQQWPNQMERVASGCAQTVCWFPGCVQFFVPNILCAQSCMSTNDVGLHQDRAGTHLICCCHEIESVLHNDNPGWFDSTHHENRGHHMLSFKLMQKVCRACIAHHWLKKQSTDRLICDARLPTLGTCFWLKKAINRLFYHARMSTLCSSLWELDPS